MKKQTRGGFVYLVVFLRLLLIYQLFMGDMFSEESYTYGQYQEALESEQVERVVIKPNEEVPTGEVVVHLKSGDSKQFYDTDVNNAKDLAQKYNIKVVVQDVPRESFFMTTILKRFVPPTPVI